MKFLDNMKLGAKTLVPVALMALVFLGVVGFAASRLMAQQAAAQQITGHSDLAIVKFIRATRLFQTVGYDAHKSLDDEGPDARQASDDLDATIKQADGLMNECQALDPQNAARYLDFKARFDTLAAVGQAVAVIGVATPGLAHGGPLQVADLDRMADGARRAKVLDEQLKVIVKDIVAFNDHHIAENAEQVAAMDRASGQAVWAMLILAVVSILGCGAIAVSITSGKIVAPLNRLAERMKSLASGDLSVMVDGQDRRDEVGAMAKAVQIFKDNGLRAQAMQAEAEQLRRANESEHARGESERRRIEAEQALVVQTLAENLGRLAQGDLATRIGDQLQGQYAQIRTDFNSAVDSLREAMSAISAAAGGIRGGSDEIAAASDDLSRRTEQQAASLEQTAAALDEITATVRRSADGARQAAEAASGAKADAERSGAVMSEAVSAMGEIEQSSGQITQIIAVIDEIAFQTNLLALNAGVEAARAGDAGRGFAVVAQEVRALAQRSAGAAKEIKGLIASSSAQVQRGVKLVGDTGAALVGIVAKVAEIDQLIGEIAKSSQEQATGLNEVNVAINQMDQVTQQNAAMVEQSTAAASNLKSEAVELGRLVTRFQTGEAERPAGPALAKAGQHKPGRNPVAQAQRRLAAATAPASSWEEF